MNAVPLDLSPTINRLLQKHHSNLFHSDYNFNVGLRIIITLLGLLQICACASSKGSQEVMAERNANSRAAPASYSTDNFYLHYRSPADRETRNYDFFYKHCKLVGRNNPAPTRSEWDCTEPQ